MQMLIQADLILQIAFSTGYLAATAIAQAQWEI